MRYSWILLLWANLLWVALGVPRIKGDPNNIRHVLDFILFNQCQKLEILAKVPIADRRILPGLVETDMASTLKHVTGQEFKNVPEIGDNYLEAAVKMKSNGQYANKYPNLSKIVKGTTNYVKLLPNLAQVVKKTVSANPDNDNVLQQVRKINRILSDIEKARLSDAAVYKMNHLKANVQGYKAETTNKFYSDDKTPRPEFDAPRSLADNPDKMELYKIWKKAFNEQSGTKSHKAPLNAVRAAIKDTDPFCKKPTDGKSRL